MLDERTGLTWTQNANLPQFSGAWDGMTWSEASAFVEKMNARTIPNYGHDDWRLPNVKELAGLVSGF